MEPLDNIMLYPRTKWHSSLISQSVASPQFTVSVFFLSLHPFGILVPLYVGAEAQYKGSGTSNPVARCISDAGWTFLRCPSHAHWPWKIILFLILSYLHLYSTCITCLEPPRYQKCIRVPWRTVHLNALHALCSKIFTRGVFSSELNKPS